MKCPDCGSNQRYRDGMVCSCGRRFALDPKKDHLTDGRFLALVNAASSNDTYYFTKNQLIAAYCRRTARGRRRSAAGVMLFGVVCIAAAWFGVRLAGGNYWLVLLTFGILAATLVPWLMVNSRPDPSVIDVALRKWRDAQLPLPRLLTAPSLHNPPPEWREPDIYDYGVESILIVERDILVDLLVKNDFHATQRCLVLSESSYPSYLQPRAAALLRERADLPVYLLHDATPEGVQMIDRVGRQNELHVAGHPLHDLGLFPADVARIARLKPALPRGQGEARYAVAADLLVYAVLASGLAQAIDQQLTLAGVLDAQAAGGYEPGSFG